MPSKSDLKKILASANSLRAALRMLALHGDDPVTLPVMMVAIRQMQAALPRQKTRPLKFRNGKTTITVRKSKAAVPHDVALGLLKLMAAVRAMVSEWPFVESGIYEGSWPLPQFTTDVRKLVDDAVALLAKKP